MEYIPFVRVDADSKGRQPRFDNWRSQEKKSGGPPATGPGLKTLIPFIAATLTLLADRAWSKEIHPSAGWAASYLNIFLHSWHNGLYLTFGILAAMIFWCYGGRTKNTVK